MTQSGVSRSSLIELTADIASAYVAHNKVSPTDLPAVIGSIFGALTGTGTPAPEPAPEPQLPAVPIRKSISDNYIICLEDGRRFKSLKRHLRAKFNLTPAEYRAKWGLPDTYPMVAPAYAASRSILAKQMGLGQGGRTAAPKPARKRAPTKA